MSIHPAIGVTQATSSGAELGLEGTEPLRRFGFLGVALWGYLFFSSKAHWNMNQGSIISIDLLSLNQSPSLSLKVELSMKS